MIRPAVITDEISQDFEHALDVMQEYGVREAELRGLWGTNIIDLDPEALARAKRALESRGIRVCAIASPLYKCNLWPEEAGEEKGPLHLAVERPLDEQLKLLERAIELTRYFNTSLIRIFAFWKQRPLTDQALAEIIAALRPAVARAEQDGVLLGLENEHACMLGTGVDTARALAAIGSPSLRGIWDPGNAFMAEEVPYPGGYAAMRPYVAHVHVKDAAHCADGSKGWTVVGQGEIDYRGQIAALLEAGYAGVFSLETHYKPTSGSAEEGSRRCLEGMLRLLREADALDTE